jgi:hypothetical protein
MLKPEEIARLLMRTDVTPSLAMIIRRAKEGDPMGDVTLGEVVDGLARMEAACRDARRKLADQLGIRIPPSRSNQDG